MSLRNSYGTIISEVRTQYNLTLFVTFYLVDRQSILFLIKFLQSESLYESEAIKRLRSTIEGDALLKDKVEKWFHSLKTVCIEDLEDISNILDSTSKCAFLSNIRKEEFLCNSLTKKQSYEYYIKWFKCFLAKSRIYDDSNHEQCEKLFKTWIDCFKSDFSMFTSVLMAIDELLSDLESSVGKNRFHSYFIDGMIDLCFEQSRYYSSNFILLLKVFFFRGYFSGNRRRGF